MKKLAMAAAVAAVAVMCGQARAYPITFHLTNTVYDNAALADGIGPNGARFVNGDSFGAFQFTIDSAAVDRGSFVLNGYVAGDGAPMFTGNVSDFISETTPFNEKVSTSISYSYIYATLAFDQTGAVTSGSIYSGEVMSGEVLGSQSGNRFSGTFGGDGTGCSACGVAGTLITTGYTPTSVPEPASLTILAFGIASAGVARRRAYGAVPPATPAGGATHHGM